MSRTATVRIVGGGIGRTVSVLRYTSFYGSLKFGLRVCRFKKTSTSVRAKRIIYFACADRSTI